METRWRLACLACLVVLLLSPSGDAGSANDLANVGKLERAAASGIVTLTNAVRARQSLPELAVNPRLTTAAERYAAAMAGQDRFDHIGADGSTFIDRAEAAGYLGWAYLGENLAWGAGHPEPAGILAGWLGSPGHRDNLLSPTLQETGVGCYLRSQPEARFWCVQAFGTPRY